MAKSQQENILNSNSFQVFLDSLMSADNNGLSTFLANQIKEEPNDISSGAAKKKTKAIKNKIMGKTKKKPAKGMSSNVVYVPSIHNGNNEVGVMLGSTDPNETSAYKNMLKNELMKEVDNVFAKLLLDNKIPIINSGKVLSYIEVVNEDGSQIENGNIENENYNMNNMNNMNNLDNLDNLDNDIDGGGRKSKKSMSKKGTDWNDSDYKENKFNKNNNYESIKQLSNLDTMVDVDIDAGARKKSKPKKSSIHSKVMSGKIQDNYQDIQENDFFENGTKNNRKSLNK